MVDIYTRSKVDELLLAKAPASHTHDPADITGVVPKEKIGTGTPAAGHYVDGGTGEWTELPAGQAGATINDATPSTTQVYSSSKVDGLLSGKADSTHTHTVAQISGTIPISKGGTGQTTAAAALASLGGVSMVDNGNGTVTLS